MNNTFNHVLEVYSKAVDFNENNEFVGFGNPNSSILIIGQEHTLQGNDWEKFHNNNCEQWIKTLKESLRAHRWEKELGDYKFPEFFNPRNPFFPKEIDYKESHTWFNYQKLMDVVCPHSGTTINFFDHCFITEMSNICSTHNPQTKDVEKSIAHRFDLMKETVDFWKHFKVVILACGPYANAIFNKTKFPNLERELFGEEGKLIPTRQFSMVSNEEIRQIQSVIIEKLDLVAPFYF